jgi:AraC-like DNA-binding protein
MKATNLSSCYISPNISEEQFIPEHFFLYLDAGAMTVYDGYKAHTVHAGDYGLGRRNHLAKYSKQTDKGKFEKIVLFFDQPFLKAFHSTYKHTSAGRAIDSFMVPLEKHTLIDGFIESLSPYFNAEGKIDPYFLDVKRTELLLILLKLRPELATVFFDFGIPEKIDLEAFMSRNYKFNVSLERFAYLTGRSLSAFKRDFEKTFHDTPSHWLVKKRLEEASFLIAKKGKKPIDIYLELGFEDLSHFSFAFKKLFGHAPSEVAGQALKKAVRKKTVK